MKNIILTGASGTIGKTLLKLLKSKGLNCIPWDRNKFTIDNYHKMESFVLETKAEAIIHLAAITSFDPELRKNSWQSNYEWPSELAWICSIHKIKFVFASTAMVFSNSHQGPYYPNTATSTTEGYGYEKRKAEERVLYQNPESVIIRLGWQISEEGQNSMITHLDNEIQKNGVIQASEKWLPSCSFVEDTVEIFFQSLNFDKGIYQLNANNDMSFYEITNFLNDIFQKNWNIQPTQDFVYEQRMFDERFESSEKLRVSKI
jgi:dTDP-4-dehydrorhamnose reductase